MQDNQPKLQKQTKPVSKGNVSENTDKGLNKSEEKVVGRKNNESANLKKKKMVRRKQIGWWIKDSLLAIINVGFIVGIVLLQSKFLALAGEFRNIRNEELKISASNGIDATEVQLESSKKKADEIIARFPNESGIIHFIDQIDKLKEEGLVLNFSFAKEEYVKDRTGYLNIPIIIEFVGTWEQIDRGLRELDKTSYILRPVSVDVEVDTENQIVNYKYGGYLYVDENLAKN